MLEDGRKLTFRKLDPGQRRNDFTPVRTAATAALSPGRDGPADFKEHVGAEKPARKKKD